MCVIRILMSMFCIRNINDVINYSKYLQDNSACTQWAGVVMSGICQVMLPIMISFKGSLMKLYVKFIVVWIKGPGIKIF